jgi:ABC-type amino acid transport substrate-binding protein
MTAFPAENIRQYNKINEGFLDLANKRVDAIIIDIPVAERYIEIKGGCKTVGGAFTEELFRHCRQQGKHESC